MSIAHGRPQIPKITQSQEKKSLDFYKNALFVVKNYFLRLKIVLLISSSVIFPNLEKTLLPEESSITV